VLQVGERLEHGLEVASARTGVEALGEALQVDVRRVDVLVELDPRLRAYVARRDRDRLDPTLAAGMATSIAYSMKTTGSLYVKATLEQPSCTAASTIRSGEASSASASSSRDFEISQFWQKRQERLQPAVPNESTEVPGRKWLSGFFSIGSTQKPLERP
jgi:hypothetical protein